MTFATTVESIFALSLALYFGQQSDNLTRGHLVYDRSISVRSTDPRFSMLRAVTGTYHPNFLRLDTVNASLWTYLQHFKDATQIREQNPCVVGRLPDHLGYFIR